MAKAVSIRTIYKQVKNDFNKCVITSDRWAVIGEESLQTLTMFTTSRIAHLLGLKRTSCYLSLVNTYNPTPDCAIRVYKHETANVWAVMNAACDRYRVFMREPTQDEIFSVIN